MEAALVFRRVFVVRPAACPSKGGPCKYMATLLPRKRLDDRPPPPAPVKTSESRRGAFLRTKRPVPVLMNLFICVVLVLFVVPCPGSHGAATRAPADLPRESSQNGRRNISEDSGENVEVPRSPSSADQASGSVVSTPSHAEEHTKVQTVSKKEAHIDSPRAHSTAEVPTEEGTDAEVGRENAASAEKRAVGEVEPAAAPEDAVEEAESTKTVSDGNQKAAQAHKETPRGGEENTAVRMNPPADMSSARNREEESTVEEGKVNAPQNKNSPAADSSETGAGENSVTLDNWLAALAIASLNPAEAAAVAAELPVVPLSKQEQMLVQQLLLRNGSNHLASYLKESSRESDIGVDKIAGEGAVTDDITDKEIYNVALKELQAYKPSLHRRLPSYDSVPRQQRDLIQRRAAEIILLRLRDTMLAHAQKEYTARQERLRQGLSSEPHFLLEVIEKIRRNPGTNPSQDIRPEKAQHSRSTADSETTTPDESFTARKEPIRRERNSVETPHWGFVKRQLERMEHSYGTQTEKERQVVPLHAGDVEGQPELEGPSSAAERQNSQASIAGAHGESLYTQLHQTHDPQNITHAPDDRAVDESAQAPQHMEEEFEFEDIEAAARAISMPEEAQREDEASDESLETERLRRVAPQSLEVLKAAVLAGNPIALALLRYLPGDIPRLQGETSQGNDRLRGHPSAKLPAEPLVLPQDGTYQLHNPPPAASVHLHQATPQFENYAGKTRPDQEAGVAAPKRHPLEANEPLWRRQRGDTDDQTKPPLWITEYQPMDEDEDLQMQTATDTSRSRRGQTSAEQQVAPSAEQHVAPNTIEPNPIVDGQTNRKQLQATSTPTLQDFIISKSKASLGSATPHDTIQQADVDTEGTSAARDETLGPYITPQQTVNQERLQTERKDGREGQLSPTPTEYEAAVSGDTSYPPLEEKAGEAEGNGSGGLTDEEVEEQPLDASEVEMVTNLPSLPSPGTRAPPMLFHVPHQHLSTPYTQGTTVQQTPPAVGDGYIFSHSPSKPAPQEYEGHPPEVLVNAPLHTNKDVALGASRSGNSSTEDEIAKFLKATLPIWAVGSTLGHLPSFSSAGEAAAVVATGPTGDAAAAPSNPFVTFTGSPAVVSYSFSGAGDTDAGRKDTVTTWRFSPPTPPMLQTLPARGMSTEDTDGTQQGETREERNREGTHSTYISDSTVHFAPTALPYSSASMPPEQHPVPPYSLPASTLPTGERDAQVDASVFAQYVMPSTPWLTAGTWAGHPSYPSPSPADARAPSYIGTGGSMHQPATIPSVETLASRPYIPLAAPLTPSHGHEAPDNHRAGPPVHSNVPRTYDAGEQLDEQETASTGRHMRGIGTGTALTAMVDGSARHAVGAAASALPQLAHSAEQLMTTTSALVNAGNALAKSLPIEEAAQLGQYLNDLRMRRKEGPPPPNCKLITWEDYPELTSTQYQCTKSCIDPTPSVAASCSNGHVVTTYGEGCQRKSFLLRCIYFGEPSVRCMSSGMICCVPQKAVGPEWKKKPPYLNDSSPSNRVCQAHFVPLQDAVCAATEYDDKECGIERIETSSTVVFKHNLHMRGPKRLTAICECHWKQSKQENKTNEGESTPMPNKAPGETVEGFAQWKYSKKAMVEGQAARAKTEKLMSGLGAALKATALLTEHGSTVADSSSASTLQEADTSVDQSKRLRSGVSALADALLEDKANNPSMKYVKQALADIARAAGGA